MNKVAGVLIGLALGWVAEQATKDVLRKAGVNPKAARVAGAVVGAIVS